MAIVTNYEPFRAVSTGKYVADGEIVSGLAVDMNGPLTREGINAIQEAKSILELMNSLPVPALQVTDSEDGQSSSKAKISESQ